MRVKCGDIYPEKKKEIGEKKKKKTTHLSRHIYSMEASGPEVQQHKVPQDRRSPAAMKSSRASPSPPLEPLSGSGEWG